ncbi:hypothetical protein FOZ63_022898 [Perkinsus olseni]|uniref:DDE Tnp4 domain-containing protein n=1 Tax=Perkinsus olseni TaxID=32597 RepID=A0A7J6MRX2_PEROL|nr:hypothetical protein FOZ60_001294 [Perkinsus olseni]KAF4737510.1 hypothetical protein FOZ63_022898 [Perkinsus olseni]
MPGLIRRIVARRNEAAAANAQRRREHRLHLSPRALADPDFLAQFRLAPMAVEELITEIGGTLEEALTPRNRRGNRGRPIPLSTVVCIGLKYLGHNTTFRDLAVQFGTSLGTVQRCIDGFVFAVIGICTPREVVFPPPNTADVMQAFKARRGIPHIVGAVDGCHVRLAGRPPGVVNADAFYCRKGFFSLNCLFIVSPDLTISYAFSRYGGSSHDSFILRRSHLWDQLNRVDGLLPNRGGFPAKLLGDAGYPLMPNLLTPYSRGAGGAVDEDSFGVLKSRFRCLHTGLRVDIDQASRVIAASVTLHNMARRRHWRAIREENDGDDGLAMGNGRNALLGFNDVEQMVLAEDPATLRNVRTSAAMKALAKRRRDQLAALLALVRVAGVDQ